MKKFLIVLVVLIAVIAAGVIGYAIHGTAANAPTADGENTGRTANQPAPSPSGGACTADDLTGTVTLPEGGAAAGNRYYELAVTKSSVGTCTISGYPGVSLTDASGTQVGSPADKDTAKSAVNLSLTKGERAVATLHAVVSDNLPAGSCRDGATGVKVYPPNATGYLSIPSNIATWCPGFTTTAFAKA